VGNIGLNERKKQFRRIFIGLTGSSPYCLTTKTIQPIFAAIKII
jgi:hypothetical protein